MAETPKLPRRTERRSITVSIDLPMYALYEIGKRNSHDTPEIVRQAIMDALKRVEPQLRVPAK